MSGFKRFVYIVCGLLGLVGVCVLALSWYGPWEKTLVAFMSIDIVYLVEEVLIAIAGLVCLVTLGKGLFSPRSTNVVIVSRADGGDVSITSDAVASRVTSIVEADGSCIADEVDVHMRSKGTIRVHVHVQPVVTLDVIAKGEQLQAELKQGLESLCGNHVENITLEFAEPQQETAPGAVLEDGYAAYDTSYAAPAGDTPVAENAQEGSD